MALKKELLWTAPDSGVTFELKPIPPLNFDDFNNAYDKRHPKPKPPLMEITVVDKKLAQPNPHDPYFVNQLEDWAAEKEHEVKHFMLAKGVVNEPPPDWEPDELLYDGDLKGWQRKALWVSDQLHTVDDIRALIEAVQSINTVTEGGLEESKKDTELQQVAATFSSGNSSHAPTPSNSTIP